MVRLKKGEREKRIAKIKEIAKKRKDLTETQVYFYAKKHGFGIKKQDALDIIREVRGKKKSKKHEEIGRKGGIKSGKVRRARKKRKKRKSEREKKIAKIKELARKRKDLSNMQIYLYAKKHGFAIRKQDALKIIREVRNIKKSKKHEKIGRNGGLKSGEVRRKKRIQKKGSKGKELKLNEIGKSVGSEIIFGKKGFEKVRKYKVFWKAKFWYKKGSITDIAEINWRHAEAQGIYVLADKYSTKNEIISNIREVAERIFISWYQVSDYTIILISIYNRKQKKWKVVWR